MALLLSLVGILGKASVFNVLGDLVIFIASLWIAVIVGVLVGWAWKPKWANFGRDFFDSFVANNDTHSSFASIPSFNSLKIKLPSLIPRSFNVGFHEESSFSETRFV